MNTNFTTRKVLGVVGLAGLVALGAACGTAQPKAGPVTNPPKVTTPVTVAPVTEAPVTAAPVTEAPAPPTTATPAPAPAPALESKGFVLQSLSVDKDFTDAFEGTARIVDNEGGRSGAFTITLFVGETIVGTMSGYLMDAPAGTPQTVDFSSTDKNVGFERYEFQVDSAF